jgi:hypothetical protein
MSRQPHSRDNDATDIDGALSRSRRTIAYLLLGTVMCSVAAMSWAGLYAFARQTMGWSGWHAALVPVALDIAALACAFMALDSLSRNDSAMAFRVITAALVALSAFVNWRHALASGNVAEQLFFPAMSVLSYAMIDAVLRKYRRDTRRDLAGRSTREALAPLPRTGLAVWLRFPSRAFGAVSSALAERVEVSAMPTDATRRRDYATGVLDGLSQADAIRAAIAEVGGEPRQVVDWLAERGRPVATQRVYDVIRRDRDGAGKHRAIYAINGSNGKDAAAS